MRTERSAWRWAVAGLALVLLALPTRPVNAQGKVEYNRDVRPILSDNCFTCHGPDAKNRKGKLRLDTAQGAFEDREGGPAVVPGKPDDSELLIRILSDDPLEQMPPPASRKKLTPAQRETLRRWVEQGAVYQPHWAYIPPTRPAIPKVAKPVASGNAIDAFIAATLATRGVEPSPEADRRTLIRRASLDLTGLPPTPEEAKAFLDDKAPDAYEKLVDRLLASPHHGERMAQHWLDVVRYADTVGFHGDQNQNVWPYRDYVIASFARNKPFDRFTTEQLAGDLLPNPTPEQLTATCFNRLNMMTREGGAQPKEYLAKYTADRIRTVGMAWLGSTLNCCECHDHKFDPFTMKDFYSIGAFFADVKQWGVYADYGYTPNPDLPGWTNDHPWPPEIQVESPALRLRARELADRIGKAVEAATPRAEDLASWKEEILAFLKAHPRGWSTPEPEVTSNAARATPRAGRNAAGKSKASPSTRRAPAAPEIEDDGRVVFPGNAATDDVLEIPLAAGWLSSARVELLPDPDRNGRILRTGERTTVRPTFALAREGKSEPLAIRHAQANHALPRYANGFEIIGVQGGWLTDPKAVTQAHEAVYTLQRPTRVVSGDRLRVTLPGNAAAVVRVGASPLALPDLALTEFPHGLADEIDLVVEGKAFARSYYLRSTAWEPSVYETVMNLERQILECHDGKTPVMITQRTEKPLTIRVLRRGNWMDESGEIRKPATPAFLPAPPDADTRELTRLDLARWLCSPENPLTARVEVNRLWRQFLGNGLSAQVDDLGAQGEPPSHPELLDWLAVEFRESGWNIRHIVKLIVMSHTYRQSSKPRPELRESDPNNRLLASQNARRLEAEVVRDNALAISGLIELDLGGPPVHPYQPAGYYEGLQFPDRAYVPEPDERQYRRGIYMHWQRTFLQPMLANFDAPSREDCLAMRTNANSPQQALTLLNDPSFVEASRAWAARLLQDRGDDASRVARAFEQALTRPVSAKEKETLLAFLGRMRREYQARPDDAAKLLKVGFVPAPKGVDPVELAAWTNVCRTILNLHETITRY